MARYFPLCGLVIVVGMAIVGERSLAQAVQPVIGWTYRAEVMDVIRDATRTTTLTFLGLGEPQGRPSLVVITAAEWGTTLSVFPIAPGPEPVTVPSELGLLALRWPTVLDFVPELRGAMPPVQGVVIPAVRVDELEWSLAFRMRLDGGRVERGEIRLVLGPCGEVTVGAGTFAGLYSTTYSASWGRTFHQGAAWWPGEGDTAGPAWIPVWAQGTLGAEVRYTWELVERIELSPDELQARLRDALAATERVDPALAREVRDALRKLGIEVR